MGAGLSRTTSRMPCAPTYGLRLRTALPAPLRLGLGASVCCPGCPGPRPCDAPWPGGAPADGAATPLPSGCCPGRRRGAGPLPPVRSGVAAKARPHYAGHAGVAVLERHGAGDAATSVAPSPRRCAHQAALRRWDRRIAGSPDTHDGSRPSDLASQALAVRRARAGANRAGPPLRTVARHTRKASRLLGGRAAGGPWRRLRHRAPRPRHGALGALTGRTGQRPLSVQASVAWRGGWADRAIGRPVSAVPLLRRRRPRARRCRAVRDGRRRAGVARWEFPRAGC